jgi:DNA-binding beta-propeller fold protein YncE
MLFALLCAAGLALAQTSFPDLGYRVAAEWPQLPLGWSFQETAGVAVDAGNQVYVCHRRPHPILQFDAHGKFVRSLGEGLFDRPHGLRIDPQGNLWVVDDRGQVVVKMDVAGRVRMVLGCWQTPGGPAERSGDYDVRFNRPTDVAWAPNGDIYVSDGYGNSRVVKFSPDGRYLTEWGRKGQGPGEFNTVHSVAVDKRGRVYVADRENRRIQIFDGDGKFLAEWRHVGAPWGLQITPEQELYMCDGYDGRVLKLSLDGRVLGAFGKTGKRPGEFLFVHNLAVAPDGTIYTAEILNWRPQKFVPR